MTWRPMARGSVAAAHHLTMVRKGGGCEGGERFGDGEGGAGEGGARDGGGAGGS